GLGRGDEARDSLTAGLESDPHSTDILSGLAVYALSRHDIAEARRRVGEAQAQAPRDFRLVSLAGAGGFTDGKYAEAETDYQRVIDAQPWNVVARLALARSQIASSKFKEANANLAIVLKAGPKDANANYLQALSAFRSKDYNTALT